MLLDLETEARNSPIIPVLSVIWLETGALSLNSQKCQSRDDPELPCKNAGSSRTAPVQGKTRSYREGFAPNWNNEYASLSQMLNASLSLTKKKKILESYFYEHFCPERARTEWSLPAFRHLWVIEGDQICLVFGWKDHAAQVSSGSPPGVTSSHLPVNAHHWDPPKVCLSEEMAKLLMSTPSFQGNKGGRQWLDDGTSAHARCWNWFFQNGTISV